MAASCEAAGTLESTAKATSSNRVHLAMLVLLAGDSTRDVAELDLPHLLAGRRAQCGFPACAPSLVADNPPARSVT